MALPAGQQRSCGRRLSEQRLWENAGAAPSVSAVRRAAGGQRRAGGEPSGLRCGQGSTGRRKPPRAGTEAENKQQLSLPPFGLTRPAGKPAQPRSGLSPAAPDTTSQTGCCEGPAFYDCSVARPTSRQHTLLTKSFTESERYICYVVAFFLFLFLNGKQRNKLRLRRTQAAHCETLQQMPLLSLTSMSFPPFSLRSPWGSHEVTLHITVTQL